MNRRDAIKHIGRCAGLAAIWGCQSGKSGVLQSLPDPLVDVHSPKRRQPAPPRLLDPATFQVPTTPTPQAHLEWLANGQMSPRWECIVVHHSATPNASPSDMDRFHRENRGWDELGYHFVIGNGIAYPDGQVYVGSRWPKQKHGAHCKTPDNYYNDHGVGICLIGNFDQGQPSAAQMASLATLCAFLTDKGGIGRSRVYTHRGITHRTNCPGQNFDMDNLLWRMRQFG